MDYAKLVPNEVNKRLNSVRPFRVFKPCADLLASHGMCRLSDLEASIASVSHDNLKASVSKFVALNSEPTPMNSSLLKSAKRFAIKDLFPEGVPDLKPMSDVDSLMQRTNWTANCGFPYFKKKGLLRDVFLKHYIASVKVVNMPVLKDVSQYPSIIFSRLQVREPGKVSIRGVYAEPGLYVGCESMYSQPIVDWAVNSDSSAYIIGHKQSELSARVTLLTKSVKHCFDFKSYDLTLHPDLITCAFSIIKMVYASSGPEHAAYIDYLCERFKYGSNYHPLVGVVARRKGLPSGSAFTNLVGTISNIVLTRYYLLKCGFNWAVNSLLMHGDDSVVATKVRLPIKAIASIIDGVGMSINMEKTETYCSGLNTVSFLGSLWNNGLPERDIPTMSSKACLVTGKPIILPKIEDYVKSRVFSIFGFDHRLPKIWSDLGFGKLEGQRVFLLNEGLAWDQSLKNRASGVEGSWVIATANPWMER